MPCADGSPTALARQPSCSVTKRCYTGCRAGSTRHGRCTPRPCARSMSSAARGYQRARCSGNGGSSCSPERLSAPRPRPARASRSSRRWAPPTRARPPPRCWPSRSSSRAAMRRRSGTPTSPRPGPRPTTWPRRFRTRCSRTCSRGARRARARRGDRPRSGATLRALRRHLPAGRRTCRPRGCAGARRPRQRRGRGAPRRHRSLPAQGRRGFRRPRPHKSGATGTRGSTQRRVAVVESFAAPSPPCIRTPRRSSRATSSALLLRPFKRTSPSPGVGCLLRTRTRCPPARDPLPFAPASVDEQSRGVELLVSMAKRQWSRYGMTLGSGRGLGTQQSLTSIP